MPIGIIVNCLAVVVGGLIGSSASDLLSDTVKVNLNMIFGLASMGMGVSSVVLMQNMPAVILALVIGTLLGLCFHLGEAITKAAAGMQKLFHAEGGSSDQLVTVIVLFCASGTGIYGSIVSGMSGDHSILIAKSILDFFTAMIFACSLKKTVSLIAVPQFIIMMILFVLAGYIMPLTTPAMINDFKACGGFIMIASGFRILQLKMFPTADMIPAMILVMPLSFLWVTYILPLLA
ncbi:MAG: DUF554 domain-containing protein [Erysipelotrichaceae bacterium]|nr:DUF554 domain-containing protein [Solobacterium sp.]MDO5120558.1 DUF554 domain-containing protein [Erysipelotrichaceae bacterium]